MGRILIVDDEVDFREALAESLADAGHAVLQAGGAAEALAEIERAPVDLLLTDIRMRGASGLELLEAARVRMAECRLIVMTAFASVETAVQALRGGAHDYLVKPLNFEAVRHKIEQHLQSLALQTENRYLRRTAGLEGENLELLGGSRAMTEIARQIERVALTDTTVLITGETGTGKELVARAIHRLSPRSRRPFVAINASSIAETLLQSELFGHVRGAFTGADRDKRGLFEVASHGTLFLDEVAELPPSVQSKLLRALEAREILPVGSTVPIRVHIRLISATNRPLDSLVREGRFRQDLFYRLNVFAIHLPPLRERREDIPALVGHFIERFSREMKRPAPKPDDAALETLLRYSWPGNVRELGNVIERTLILSDGGSLRSSDLPPEIASAGASSPPETPGPDDLRSARRGFERAHVAAVLRRHGGDKSAAARALGIDLSSLYRKLEE
jgi:two-component system response regulator AtoC